MLKLNLTFSQLIGVFLNSLILLMEKLMNLNLKEKMKKGD